MARPSNTHERRVEIVEGLLRVMSERGYERASINEIARAAGLTAGLIHYHFGSKQQILLALVERLASAFQTRLAGRLRRAGDDPVKRLHAFLDAHLALDGSADPRIVAAWVTVGAEAIRQPEVRAAYVDATRKRLDTLRELLAACLHARGRGTRDARKLAGMLLAAIEGAYQFSAAAPELLPAGYAAPTLRRMVEGILA
ncbi:MAG: TetR/AcrR family transcriptional regulator [Proteobacteria bacterium]|nr:TetR/AcrR family transcriptional regulator [Pseudomonadota bacterium]